MNDHEKYLEKLKTHRRQLHQIPEIDRDLPETKAYLLSVLEQLDCELTFLCGLRHLRLVRPGSRRYLRLPFRHGWTACDGSQHM